MWLLVALIAASLVSGRCQTIVEVDVTESKAFRLSVTGTEIQNCYITLPGGGSAYELLPDTTVISQIDERFTISSSDKTKTCGLSIDSTRFSDSGLYSISITDTEGVSHTGNYELRVQGRSPIWPSTTVNLIASKTVYVFLQTPEGTVKNCYVTAPGSAEAEVKYGAAITTDIKQWSPNSDSWCGVEISKVSASGYWKLTAALNATHFYYNRISLNPEDASTSADTSTVLTPIAGQSLTDYIGHEDASYCQLTNPQGEVSEIVAGRCSFNLPLVTSQHNGTWKASAGLKGSPDEITETIELNVQALKYINAESSQNQVISGAIDLYCRVDGVESEICRFVSPTGTGVSMILGVGNDKYAPYYDPEGLYTCGLTILELSDDDYGTWTCYTGNTSDLRKGYISVSPIETQDDLTKSSRMIATSVSVSGPYTAYSVYNESLKLSCSALASLNYCWFGHPNGSHYTAVPDVIDNDSWSYSGSGLSLGSCSITFTHSNYNDTGLWTCNMGIVGQETDIGVNIDVKVTSSSLIAISVEETDGKAAIECAVLDDTKALSYCRFIRPDGVGINAMYANSDSKYRMTGDMAQGVCGLTLSAVQDVDKGTWSCLGKLESESIELSDTFLLSSTPKLAFSLVLLGAASIIGTLLS